MLVSFEIENSGEIEGDEIAQLYIQDIESSEERPFKELKNFIRVNLKPGERKKIELEISNKELAFYSSKEGKWIAEEGKFRVLIGSSSQHIHLTDTFEYY